VDQLLQHRIVPGRRAISDPDPQSLLGQVAIAKAKLAYQTFKRMLASDRWQAMAARGAHVQRMLWASTSAKNAAYHDLMYVEPLVGPYTINTMPRQTIAALLEHGIINATVEEGVAQAELVMADLKRLGIDFGLVAAQLENEGIQKFIDAYDALLKSLATKRENMAAIIDALHQGAKDGSTAIIARTEKGKGVSFLEGANAWHGKPLDREQMNKALAELGDVAVNLTVQPQRVGRYQTRHAARPPAIKPDYRQGEAVATQPGAPR
jgi:hypothetical protein